MTPTPQSNLDVSGDFRHHPFAELMIEILQARLSGALRLEFETKKTIIYFRDGRIVFGVSNAREHRLFARMIAAKRITPDDVKQIRNSANDMEFAAELCKKGVLSKETADEAFVSQIGEIIIAALSWPNGNWHFSPLARLRSDVFFDIQIYRLLMDYARCLPSATVMARFMSVQERFVRPIDPVDDLDLQPQEACVLELFADTPLDFNEIRDMSSMPESALAQSLYALWLGGALLRLGWNKAFTEAKIGEIKKTIFARVKQALPMEAIGVGKPVPERIDEKETVDAPEAEVEDKVAVPVISLDEWLERAEAAEHTHYDLLAIEENASTSEVKSAYFGLAKLFHPDRYHRETGTSLRRIQVAFTDLAHAYETLKNPEARTSYNYKIRKEMEVREKRKAEGVAPDNTSGAQSDLALESFEQGLSQLNDENYAAAAGYLARAVHYSPNNALYRAYYGKALSEVQGQLHKAEAEMQAAAKLEPANSKVRLMLVNFFIERNMKKRAEGELNRFLEIAPDNTEARTLLDDLQRQM